MAAGALVCAGFAAGSGAIHAQTVSRPVVQAVPTSSALDDALMQLARNPRSPDALIQAGMAALDIGDTDAAVGFFSRAQEVAPGDPRAKAGMGAAFVLNENPYDALLMFDEADRAGGASDFLARERGLAWDLVGDNLQAQKFYRQALGRANDDEVSRRLAFSLAVSGDRKGADKVLSPLLGKGDSAAWRTRAFIEAISGNMDEAQKIAARSLPSKAGEQIVPYLRYMPRLTAAQQVAAATFGHFPRTADIGQDDPRIAKYAKDALERRAVQAADSTLIPSGEPLGRELSKREQRALARKAEAEKKKRDAAAAVFAAVAEKERLRKQAAAKVSTAASSATPPVPRPSLAVATGGAMPASNSALANVRAAQATGELPPKDELPPVAPQTALPPIAPPADARPVRGAATAGASQIASFGGDEPVAAPTPGPSPLTQAPEPALPPVPAPVHTSVADAFSGFAVAPARAPVASGAVDITRIKPRIEQPPAPKVAPESPAKVEKKPAPPAYPSRNWVQVATGRDTNALKWDWRRINRTVPDLVKGKKPYIAGWGQTNRMVTGPFDSGKAAQEFVTALKEKGIDSFLFTSAEGEKVEPLPTVK
ncbi:MAG: SPOR domain-containing protein [Novosphingobium sp.]